jgi:hypothetical protein
MWQIKRSPLKSIPWSEKVVLFSRSFVINGCGTVGWAVTWVLRLGGGGGGGVGGGGGGGGGGGELVFPDQKGVAKVVPEENFSR